jgi:uncharacterized integral membrane protein (TIGR00698 family)
LPKDRLLFFAALAASLSPWGSPPAALVLGVAFALLRPHPFPSAVKTATKLLLQASVVGLGFGMDLRQVLRAGMDGITVTAGSIALTMIFGVLLGRALGVASTVSYLISTGTAICGGSAIAAVGPVVGAEQEEMSVSLGTVFILNSVALLVFPWLGAKLGLTQHQFGWWAALAIHDTSSVVGAAAKYGAAALAVGTTVKLARALWIVPLTLVTAALKRSKASVQWPWFIVLFALAAAVNTALPEFRGVWAGLNKLARLGLTATLFLIGTGISKAALKKVGPRPLLQGVLLWIAASCASLAVVLAGLVG